MTKKRKDELKGLGEHWYRARLSQLSDEKLSRLFETGLLDRIDFWVFCHAFRLWQLIHLNWFNPGEGE